MPFGVSGYPNVVVLKGKVYIGGGITVSNLEQHIVVIYDPEQDSCDTLPPYAYKYFSLAIVNDQLILVGGWEMEDNKPTNKLGMWNGQLRRWTHPLPPMTTACSSPSVATHNNRWLVVMGGNGDKALLSRVEILNTTDPIQWYQAVSLPQPCRQAPCVTTGNMCYLLCGYTEGGATTKRAFSACLDVLISQAIYTSAGFPPTHVQSLWQFLPDSPRTQSTALAFQGALLVIGGGSLSFLEGPTIYIYQPSRDRWVEAGELPTKRWACGCTVLPSGEVLVVGGDYGETRQMIEIASIL